MKTKILLADDHQIVRDGLHHLLGREKDMEVVAEVENGRAAVQLAAELSPDVVVMDVSMPDMNGIEATRQILRHDEKIKVVALSMHSDRRYVARMLEAGAAGYLVKDSAIEEVVSAIRSVVAGKRYLSPQIVGMVIEGYVQHLPDGAATRSAVLTLREREILQLLAEGKSTREIAAALCLSGKTVDTHRRKIMNKLNLHSVAELTKYALREGITSLDN